MSGACFITGHSEEIAGLYEVGREIETYASTEELVDKVRFLLRTPSAAAALRIAGRNRAVRSHTWVQRFRQLDALTRAKRP